MENIYWLWLMSLEQIGNGTKRRLLEYFDSVQSIFNSSEKELCSVQGIKKTQIKYLMEAKNLELAKKAADYLERHHIRLITIDDFCFPSELKTIYDPPVAFFAKGNIELLKYPFKIGVVGSRKASPSGLAQSKKFAQSLSEKGVTVVSGFAQGIDASAHAGAMREIGSTICVLGSGINVCYPIKNQKLYHDVLFAGGLIISEFFLDSPPLAFHFPMRNRIISGLSKGVLVVEAAEKSGALVTARHALDQGKNVYVIPKDITLIQSVGSNQLIKDGAKVVTEVKDILEDFIEILPDESGELYNNNLQNDSKHKYSTGKESPVHLKSIELEPNEDQIVKSIREGYDTIDQLIYKTGFDISQVNMLLSFLEIKDIISVQFGKVTLK